MRYKKLVIFLVILFLNMMGVFAQAYFSYSYYGRSSGFSNIISDTLDFVFGGILEPVMDAIGFAHFETAIKVALWIILYMLFSWLLKEKTQIVPKKFAKVIAAIIAIFSVVFMPDEVLRVLFVELLGGLVGYLLFVAFIVFPLYGLYKFSKESEERAVNLTAAAGFFLMMVFITYLDEQVVYNLPFGIMQTLGSLTIAFGVLASLIFFIHRLVRGLRGLGGGEELASRRRERRRPQIGREEGEGDDETEQARAFARRLKDSVGEIMNHVRNLSVRKDDPAYLAFELAHNPGNLNFLETHIPQLFNGIDNLVRGLNRVKGKKKSKAKSLASQIYETLQKLNDDVEDLRERWDDIVNGINKCRDEGLTLSEHPNFREFHAWFNQQSDLQNLFGWLTKLIEAIRKDLGDLIEDLSDVERL